MTGWLENPQNSKNQKGHPCPHAPHRLPAGEEGDWEEGRQNYGDSNTDANYGRICCQIQFYLSPSFIIPANVFKLLVCENDDDPFELIPTCSY